MAVNLIRNSRVFFTTNVDSAGNVRVGSTPGGVILKNSNNLFSADNTFEIQVLEGLSFTQNTTSDTVTLNETGDAPNRGQRSFNTALEPVDFSFSTYVRPYLKNVTTSRTGAYFEGGNVTCEERFLWNAFASADAIGAPDGTTFDVGTDTGTSSTAWFEDETKARLILERSNKNQLQKFGLIIAFSDQVYVIDNCAMDTATIDFGIDQIAAIQWAGKGTLIRSVAMSVAAVSGGTSAISGADTAGSGNAAKAKNANARYITNKLSVLSLDDTIAGTTGDYKFAITGGSITLANNITYITPANLAQVNLPITYYTGTRSVTGTFNAYLKSGSGSTNKTSGQLLQELLQSSSTDTEPSFAITFDMGGTSGTFVKFYVPAAVVQIPTVNTEQVISTTINFTGQGYSSTDFNIEKDNELAVTYNCIAV